MSKQVDERIVEMRFDNKHFESNVQTSMSTLDKLKQSLRFKDAEKGFDNLDKSAKKVDMTHLEKGIGAVQAKFSALEIMGTTALVNITNSAINAGKRIVSALTIDPIKTGFSEYETQINATQTILANTASKGSTIKDVNKALEELNKYADLTIYNFTEMTRNIGTFTAAGIDLETSVNAIQGIANLAAVSGSTSQQASTAMYQLSQALSTGTVRLMDWNSVVNAGMGGEMFQNALKETSKLLGTGAEAAIKAEGSFRESLKTGWLTSEVLTETLKKFTTTGANERVAEYTGLSKEAVEAALEEAKARYGEADAIEHASKALAEKSGKNADEIKSVLQFAKTAEDAATKVKTFTQLWDVMKESAQSGWAQTWKLIVGDFEQARNLLTPLSDFFTGLIGKMSDARNRLIEGALGKSFTKLGERISGMLKPVNKAVDAVKNASDALKDYGVLVDEIIAGKWGNAPTRWQDLTEAGYDWAHAQNLVNERLGDSTRHATDYKEAQEATTEVTTKLTGTEAERLEQLIAMSDAELRSLGYTEDQIKAFRELEREAKKLGLPIKDFIEQIDTLNGRTILFNSFKNIGQGLYKTFKALGDAWREIFPPPTSDQLYNVIAALHKFSMKLRVSDETADKLKRTFKGVFALLDIILTLVGGPIKLVFKILGQVLGVFNLDLLSVTAVIGDAIVGFRDWLDRVLDFTKVFQKMVPAIQNGIKMFRNWIAELKQSDNIPRDIVLGLVNGLKNGFSVIGETVMSLGKHILETIKKVLGIHSPSTEFFEIGMFIIEGLLGGLKAGAIVVWDFVKLIGSKMLDIIRELDFGKVFAAVVGGGLIYGMHRVVGIFEQLLKPLDGLSDLLTGAGSFLEDFGIAAKKFSKAMSFKMRMEGVKALAEAILILAAALAVVAVVAWSGYLYDALGALGIIAAGVVAFVFMLSKIGTTPVDVGKLSAMMIATSIALGLMTGALKQLEFLGKEETNVWKILAVLGALDFMLVQFALISKIPLNSSGLSGMFIGLSVALLGMTWCISLLGNMDPLALEQGMNYLVAFMGMLTFMVAMSKIPFGSNNLGSGGMFIGIAATLLAMVWCVSLLGNMDPHVLAQGIFAVSLFTKMIAGLIFMSKFSGGEFGNGKGSGLMFVGIAATLLAMAECVKILGGMEPGQLLKGVFCVGVFSALIAGLIYVSKFSGNAKGMLGGMIGITLVLGVMTAICILLGLMPTENIIKGIAAVAVMGVLLMGLIAVSKQAEKAKGGLIGLAAVLAVMALVMVAFTFIKGTELAGATVCLGALMGMLSLMIKAAGTIQGKAMGSILAIAAVLLALAYTMDILAYLPIEGTLVAAGVLTELLVVMSGVLWFLGKFCKNTGDMIGGALALLALCGTLAIVANILKGMSDVKNAVTNAGALSILLGTMTGVCAVMSAIGKNATNMILGALGLLALCVPVYALVGVLALMNGVKNAITNAAALSLLLVSMTAMLGVIGLIGNVVNEAAVLVAVLGLITICAALIVMVGVLYAMNGVKNAMPNVMALSAMLIVMTGVLVVLSVIGNLTVGLIAGVIALGVICLELFLVVEVLKKMESLENAMVNTLALCALLNALGDLMIKLAIAGPLALVGVGALAALTGLIIAIGAFALAVGAVMENISCLKGFLETGINTLVNVVKGIGKIVTAFAEGMVATLPLVGEALGQFMIKAMPFIIGAQLITKGVAIGIGVLTGAIMALTAAGIIEGFRSLLGMESGLSKIGKELGKFYENGKAFFEGVKTINPAALEGVRRLAEAVLIFTAADMLDGIKKFFTGGGESSLAKFGEEIGYLGEGLGAFRDGIGDFGEGEIQVVKAAAESVKILAEAADAIPNEGGWAGKIFGENNLGKFAEDIVATGDCLVDFADTMSGFGEDDAKKVELGAKAIKSFSEAAKDIPNDGGMAAFFAGENNLGNFAEDIEASGECLVDFAKTMDDFTDEDMAKVEHAVNSIKQFVEVADDIPNSGGVKSWFTGDNNIANFSKDIQRTGECLKEFAGTMTGVNVASTSAAVTMLEDFGTFADVAPEKESIDNMKKLAKSMVEVGKVLSGQNGAFGSGSMSLWESMEGVGQGTLDRAKVFHKVITEFGNMADEVPDSTTMSNFEDFGDYAKKAVKNIKDAKLYDKMEGTGWGTHERAKAFHAVITEFAKMAKESPDSEQLDNLTDLAEDIGDIATSIGDAEIYDSLGDMGPDTLTRVQETMAILQEFETAARTIAGGGFLGMGSGTDAVSNLESLSSNASKIVEHLTTLDTNLDGLNVSEDFINDFTSVCSLFGELTASIGKVDIPNPEALKPYNSIIESANQLLDDLGSKMSSKKVKTAQNNIKQIKNLLESIKGLASLSAGAKNNMENLGGNMITALTNGLESGYTKVKNTLSKALQGMVTNTNDVTETMYSTGKDFMKSFGDGIGDNTDTVKELMNGLMKSLYNSSKTNASNFKDVGKAVVEGFATGITLNEYIADEAAKAMAKSAKQAAENELKVNSPSKVFMKTGASVVEGFAKGILDNLKESDDSGREMADSVLKATQDELDINSPSIVFKEKVGRYIVQGIAEGITKDMSAEEAAEKKAQNIVSAFQKEIDRIQAGADLRTANYEWWKAGEGKNASDEEKAKQERSYLKDVAKDLQDQQDMEYYAMKEAEYYYNNGTITLKAYQEAQTKYANAAKATLEALTTYNEFDSRNLVETNDKIISANNDAIEKINTAQSLWLATDGEFLSDEAKNNRYIEDANKTIEYLKTNAELAEANYNTLAKLGDEGAHDAWVAWQDWLMKIDEQLELIDAVNDSTSERKLELLKDNADRRDAEYELLKAQLGNNASADEL